MSVLCKNRCVSTRTEVLVPENYDVSVPRAVVSVPGTDVSVLVTDVSVSGIGVSVP